MCALFPVWARDMQPDQAVLSRQFEVIKIKNGVNTCERTLCCYAVMGKVRDLNPNLLCGWFLVHVPTLLLCLALSDDRSLSVFPLVVAPLLLIWIKLNSLSTVLNLKLFIFLKMPEISLLKGSSLCPNPGVSSSSPDASSLCTFSMSLFYLTGSVEASVLFECKCAVKWTSKGIPPS